MREWLNHHINEGVDHFHLINNGSTDDFFSAIKPFIDQGFVTLFDDDSKWAQVKLYNTYILPRKEESQWFMIIDLDEFVYARNGFNMITQYLTTIKKRTGMIRIPWKMFGSSGNELQPEKVIKSFTKRSLYNRRKNHGMNDVDYGLNKVIVRNNALRALGIHYSKIKLFFCTEDATGKKIHKKNPNFTRINEEILGKSYLHLNHYAIQSLEWFLAVKCIRGSADNSAHERVRNIEYFESYDKTSNDVEDLELKKKTTQ